MELDKQKEIEREEARREAELNMENMDVGEGMDAEHHEMTIEEEKIEIKEFDKIEKKYALCLDTLGQDRIFDENEQAFITNIAKTIKASWENLEEKLLLKDRDLRIEMNEIEAKFKEAVSINI